MRYQNAEDIFPENVLAYIQQFVDGAYIYIPRKTENRKRWGEGTKSKAETEARNKIIYARYKLGKKTGELAEEFYLSEKSIQRIITLGRKQEK